MTDPVLYILMRTDLDSMNPGKAMAQANHVYGAFKKVARSTLYGCKMYSEWAGQTPQDFGTTIVKGASLRYIQEVFAGIGLDTKLVFGWVYDPTYPLVDGDVTHLIPLYTCAFVFGEREEVSPILDHLELHP